MFPSLPSVENLSAMCPDCRLRTQLKSRRRFLDCWTAWRPFGVRLSLPHREPVEIPSRVALLPIFRLSKARGVRMSVPQWRDNRRATRRKSDATYRARAPWVVWLRCSPLIPPSRDGHARRSCLAIQPKPLSRGAAGYFNRLPDPGAWGVAPQSRLSVDRKSVV